jgi:hypothetical protein
VAKANWLLVNAINSHPTEENKLFGWNNFGMSKEFVENFMVNGRKRLLDRCNRQAGRRTNRGLPILISWNQ